MKTPMRPPSMTSLLRELRPERLSVALTSVTGPTIKGRYLHWDQLRHRPPPTGLSLEEWWFALKMRRQSLHREIPVVDKDGRPHCYALVDPIPRLLHEIDKGAGGIIKMPRQITNPATRDQYLVTSLIEEAITSSQLEGAHTTRKVARELVRTGRTPANSSERMVLNNYLTMQRVLQVRNEPLTPDLICQLHGIVTRRTMNVAEMGQLRTSDDVIVGDWHGQVFHKPPASRSLEERIENLCQFGNGEGDGEFVHPAIRSIILHFQLAYDHPFTDGNGRTARALFYWSMLRHGYWLFEYISISNIILKGPARYGRAFLHSETDGNDITYFVLYHLDVIRRAVESLHEYIQRKVSDLESLEHSLKGMEGLNHRQRALIGHALRNPAQRYTIQSHRRSHEVVYQTARLDLLDLVERGLFRSGKIGRALNFRAVEDLEERLGSHP